MRTILILTVCSIACWAGSILGTWRMDRARSRFAGADQPQSLIVSIEPHAKGRVFTLDRLEADGRSTSFSSVLYLDGTSRFTAEHVIRCRSGRALRRRAWQALDPQ
jgi:hypothetical protein